MDDILGHTKEWPEHLLTLKEIFTRVRQAGLTLKPSKCFIGFSNIGFTGHVVGEGMVQMEEDKLKQIKNAERPKTNRQVRAFLGWARYYRKFIQAFSDVAGPLTDLTKKGRPNNVWQAEQEQCFNTLKDMLTQSPILRLPDFTKQFKLQTDASDSGVGAALLQQYDNGLFPVAYASKKLLQKEKNCSVIKRECLAIVFGIRKFQFHFNWADRRLRRHLSQDEMNRGIGMLHSGLSQRHVANVLGVSQSVVSSMWNRFITTGNVRHLHAGGGGRERSTNEVQD